MRFDWTESDGRPVMAMPSDRNGLHVLSRYECLHLLAAGHVGRIGLSVQALPVVLPVNYAVLDGGVVLRSGAGTKLDAALALELGLANRVVEPAELASAACALAEELAKGPPLAFAKIKSAVRESFRGTIDDALVREKAGQIELLQTEDLAEGVMAWAQRREPEFKGR